MEVWIVRWSVAALVLGLLRVTPVLAGLERQCDDVRSRPRGFCGRRLSETLKMVCQGIYHKRSPGTPLAADKTSIEALQPVNDVFLSKTNAFSYLKHKRGHPLRVGIVCECCIHQCTFRELSQYCAGDSHYADGLYYGKRSSSNSGMTKPGWHQGNDPERLLAYGDGSEDHSYFNAVSTNDV